MQSSCFEKFSGKLKEKMERVRVGEPLDNSIDVGGVHPDNITAIEEILSFNSHLSSYKVRIINIIA